MKKLLSILSVVLALLCLSVCSVSAEDEISYDMSGVYDSLSDEARQHMLDIGADCADVNTLANLSFDTVIGEIGSMAAQSAQSPLKGLISITALLLLCSMLSAYKNSLSSDISSSLNIVAALCVSCTVAAPAVAAIGEASDVISVSSRLMLAYVPVMVMLMAASGQAIGSGAYYAAMLGAGEGVLQLSSNIIVPFLHMMLGLGITGGISPDINLKGFINMLSKASKWLLSFVMAIFTAVLGIKQMLTNSLDSISGRAVKFALSSFVPVVGSALSEAYKTVQGSVALLKSGVGIFVIIALGITFLPVIIKCLLWVLTLWLGKSVAEVLGLRQSAGLIDGIAGVFSLLIAILLCVMTVYIISTAAVLMLGGGGQ